MSLKYEPIIYARALHHHLRVTLPPTRVSQGAGKCCFVLTPYLEARNPKPTTSLHILMCVIKLTTHHPDPCTRNPKPETLNRSMNLNQKHETPHPTPTLNPDSKPTKPLRANPAPLQKVTGVCVQGYLAHKKPPPPPGRRPRPTRHPSSGWRGTSRTPTTSPPWYCFFFTLVTGPRRSLSLKLSDTRV